jgi:hypothetical protein
MAPLPRRDLRRTRWEVRKVGRTLATIASNQALIEAVIAEMTDGIDCAVDFWIGQIESALTDSHLTALGRLNAVQEILRQYRRHTTEELGGSVDGYVA